MPQALKVATASGLIAMAVTAWFWYSPESGLRAVDEARHDGALSGGADSGVETSVSPFAVAPTSMTSHLDTGTLPQQEDAGAQASPAEQPAVDVSQVGRAPMSDADYESMVARLQMDPALLDQLIDEFRQEQDPSRLALLARLLGEAGGAAMTQVASELIFSGNEASRDLGLQLLRQVQPGNSQARDIASGLLSTEVEPKVLVSTLTALAKPGFVDDDSRALLSDQVALLASNDDAGVRGISLDILSRWSTDGRDTPVLINGLLDPEARVRESAAYALVDHEDPSDAVVQSLFVVVRDVEEQRFIRRAAIMALRSMPLDDAQSNELQRTERELDTVIR
jgi:hypothetical protein